MSPLGIFTGPYALLAKWGIIALLVAAFGAWSYTKGVTRESDRRDAAALRAIEQEHANQAAAIAYGAEQAKKAQANQAKADDYRQKWKEARDAAKRNQTPLAVVDCPAQPAGGGLSKPGPVRLRLTWDFVSLWDAAYTDSAGQPVFGDTDRTEKGSPGPGTASPYTPDDVLDNHGENAARWDSCRRQLRALIGTIDGLQRAWDAAHPGP